MKKILIGSLVFIGVIIFSIGLKFILFPVNTAIKSVDMAYGVTNKTLTADNAIYNYEWFKTQYHSIESLKKKEVSANNQLIEFKELLPDSRTEWSKEDKTEYDRLNTIVNGLNNQLSDAVALYNARSEMVNRSIFKDNLPTNISKAVLEGFILTK